MKTLILFWTLLVTVAANSQTIYTVTKTTDPDPFVYPYNYIDSLCDTTMYGTLQWAIRKANDTPDSVIIQFNIPGNGPDTIKLNYSLPNIVNQVTIDGTTQQGYELNNPAIIINGENEMYGLVINANNCIIKGLYLSKLQYNGILCINADNTLIENNVINQINHTTMILMQTEGAVALYGSQYCTIRNNIIGTDKDNNPCYYPEMITSSCKNGINIVMLTNAAKGIPSNNNTVKYNKIANCSIAGVYIQQGCTSDKLSQNLIYNCYHAIRLLQGANYNKLPPVITSYQNDTLSGTSAPGDIIEVYGSTGAEQANEYLGSTTTDSSGNWQLVGQTTYQYVVATATDGNGNTSKFSSVKSLYILTCKNETLSYMISGVNTGDNVIITINFPTGIYGLNNASVQGTSVLVDTTNIFHPQYTVVAPSNSFLLTFQIRANCEIFNASTQKIYYTITQNVNNNITNAIDSFMLSSPWIVLDTALCQHLAYNNAFIGVPFTRTFVFKNTGALFSGDFLFRDTTFYNYHHTAIKIIGVECLSNTAATVIDSASQDTSAFIKLSFTNLQTDSLIIIRENVELANCPSSYNNISYFKANYGCANDSLCKQAQSQIDVTSINESPNDKPEIKYEMLIKGYPSCWNDLQKRIVKITNVGHASADTIFVTILKNGSPWNGTNFNSENVTDSVKIYKLDSSIYIPITNFTVVNGEYYCNYIILGPLLPHDSFYISYYEEIHCIDSTQYSQHFNQGINMHYEGFPQITLGHECNPTSACYDPTYSGWINWAHTSSLHQVFNNYVGTMMGGDSAWFDIQSSTPLLLASTSTSEQWGFIFNVNSSALQIKFKLDPGLGMVSDSLYIISHINGLPVNLYPYQFVYNTGVTPGIGNGDTVTAYFAIPDSFYTSYPSGLAGYVDVPSPNYKEFFSNFKVHFKLRAYCEYTQNKPSEVVQEFFFIPNRYCNPDCKLLLSSVKDKINIHCPGCILPGWNLNAFNIKRINYGYADNDNNHFPDSYNPMLPADTSLIQIHNAMLSDTLEFDLVGSTSDGGYIEDSLGQYHLVQFNNIGFNYNYGMLQFSYPLFDHLRYIGAEGTIVDSSGSHSFSLPPSTGHTYYNGFSICLDIDTLHQYGVPSTFTRFWNNNDMYIRPRFIVIKNLIDTSAANPYYSIQGINALMNMSGTAFDTTALNLKPDAGTLVSALPDSFLAMTPAQKAELNYWCTGWQGRFGGIGVDFSTVGFPKVYHVDSDFGNNNPCLNILRFNAYTEVGHQVYMGNAGQEGEQIPWNAFSYEIRNLWMLDSIKINYPTGYVLESVIFATTQLTSEDSISSHYTCHPWYNGSGAWHNYDMTDAAIEDSSATIYPARNFHKYTSFPGCIGISDSLLTAYDETKRYRIFFVIRGTECSSPKQIPANNYSVTSWWSDFPGAQSGDTAIVQQISSESYFTKPTAKLDATVALPITQDASGTDIIMDVNLVTDSTYGLWDPIINNGIAENTFILVHSASGLLTVDSIINTDTHTAVPVVSAFGNDSIYGIEVVGPVNHYWLGPIGPANIKIYADYNCLGKEGTDSVLIYTGWNCNGYPSNIYEACYLDSQWISFIITKPGLQAILDMPDTTNICDILFYNLALTATGIGNVHNVAVNMPIPQGNEYEYLPGSAYLNDNSNTVQVNPVLIGQDALFFDLDSTGLLDNFNDQTVHFTFDIVPHCSFYNSQKEVELYISAQNYCGDTISLPMISNKPTTVLFPEEDSLLLDITVADTVSGCGDSTLVVAIITNAGNNSTSAFDTLKVILPNSFSWSSGNAFAYSTGHTYVFSLNGGQIPSSPQTIQFYISGSSSNGGIFNVIAHAYVAQASVCHNDTCVFAQSSIEASDTAQFHVVPLTATVNTMNATCGGLCNGSATVTCTGIAPFIYTWSTGAITQSVSDLCAGNYSVTVTDAHGCTGTDSLLIQLITAPNANFSISSCPVMNELIQFNALDQTADTWLWTFDQNPHTSSGKHVIHGFNQDGYHCVTLTATNQCGSSTASKTIYVYSDDCVCGINYDLEDTTIQTNTLWDNTLYPNGIYLKGDIHIQSGSTLKLNQVKVYCAPDVRILVEPQAYLYIQDNVSISGLPTPCNYMWQGIEVWGNGYDTLFSNQGIIKCRRNDTISDAHIAILLGARNLEYICGDSSMFNLALSGGFPKICNTNFIDNGYGIMVISTPIRRYQATNYSGNQFLCNTVLPDNRYQSYQTNHYPTAYNPWVHANNMGITQAGIWAADAHFYTINNSTFKNIKFATQLFNTRTDIFKCSFTNNTYGIYIQNYLSTIDNRHEISQCTFDKIPGVAHTFGAAIYLRGSRYDFIHDNTFGVDASPSNQPNNNYAVYANNSKSFNISQNIFFNFTTGVNIINSGTDGGYVGAGSTTSSIPLSIWEGNKFTSCRTNIITSGNNTALKLKCNNCHNDDPNLYSVNFKNYGLLANQGSMPPSIGTSSFKQKFAAGNEFFPWQLPDRKRIESINSPYNYYRHTTPPSVIPEVYTSPQTIYGQSIGLPKTSTHEACPPPIINISSVTLNSDYDRALVVIDSLYQVEESLKSQLANLNTTLDKGKTTELLNDIYGNTSTGQLKNKLISNSPLSDTVLSALQIEDPLSVGNYKNVMEKNLPVSKKVEPLFYERLKTLPAGIAVQLSALQAYNASATTPTSLQNQIDNTYIERQLLLNQLILTLNDSLNNRKADAVAILEQINTNEARQILASTYIADGYYASALSKLNAIDDPQMQEWEELTTILLTLYQQEKNLYQLDINQINYIRELANECPATLATVNAQAILSLLYNEEFAECPPNVQNKTKPIIKLNTHKKIQAYLGNNYPDPFNSNTVIPYYLPENQEGTIVVYNILGIKLNEYKLTEGEHQLEINTSDWQQGVYRYSLYVNDLPVETKQMILIK